MDVVSGNTLLPGDPRLIDHIVCELKSQGIFDQFRKECIADVDTKPAYQNLRQRVEGSVTGFLKNQTWRPDLNKNQLREMLRKNIYESGFLETGVERIVDQVVNPKINSVFLPKVEDVVYKFLGIEKPSRNNNSKNTNGPLSINTIDLLPTDLDPISPDSEVLDKTLNKSDKSNETANLEDSKLDDFESPPFEPITEQSVYMQIEENSNDSRISGISGLTSHDSNTSDKDLTENINVNPPEVNNQDSQLSKVSSNSRLSIITTNSKHTPEKMDISDDNTQTSKCSNNIKIEGICKNLDFSNSFTSEISNSNSQQEVKQKLDLLVKQEINGDNKNVEETLTIKNEVEIKKEIEENITENQGNNESIDKPEEKVINKEDLTAVTTDEIKNELVETKKSEKSEQHRYDSEKRRDRDKDKKSDKEKDRRHSSSKSSSSSSRDKDKHRDKSKDSKTKDRDTKSKDEKDRDAKGKDEKDRYKDKSREDKDSKSRSSSSSKQSSRDKSSSKTDVKSSKDASKDDKSRSSKDQKKSDDSRSKGDSKKDSDKSESRKSDSKSKSSDDSSSKSSSKSREHSRSESSKSSRDHKSSSKDSRDKKKSSKRDKDDHNSVKKSDTRRSADRDSNDGSSGTGNNSSNPIKSKDNTESSSSNKSKSSDNSDSSQGSNSGDSGQSDSHSNQQPPENSLKSSSKILTVELSEKSESEVVISPQKHQNDSNSDSETMKLMMKKPKIASNIFEARKLMKIRKKMEKLEKKRQKQVEVNKENRNIDTDSVEDTDSMDSENLQNLDTVQETKDGADTIINAGNNSVISKESWDAIEAKLSESAYKDVNFDSYVDENDSSSSCKLNDNTIKPKTISEDEDCLYFNNQVSPTTQRFLQSVETYQKDSKLDLDQMAPPNIEKSSKRNRKSNIGDLDNKVEGPKKLGNKRKTKGKKRKFNEENDPIYSENNNKRLNHTFNIVELAEEFDDVMEPSPSASNTSNGSIDVAIKKISTNRNKKGKKNTVYNSESFSLPLSPESDKSVDLKNSHDTLPIKGTRASILKTQRYSSDDLYKPRPFVSGSSRRQRGILNSKDSK